MKLPDVNLPDDETLELFADATAFYPPVSIALRVLAGAAALLDGKEPTEAQRDAARQRRKLQTQLTDAKLDQLDAQQGVDTRPTTPTKAP